MLAMFALGATLLVSQEAPPSFVSGLSWMAGKWKSSASEYTLGGRAAGELNKTADVLMANANNSMAIRIANLPEKGEPMSPGEMIVLHTSTDGKTTKAFGIFEIADDPVKLTFTRDGDRITLVGSGKVKTPAGSGDFSDKTVIERKSNDRWIYSMDITYTLAGTPVTITQKLTFDRVPG